MASRVIPQSADLVDTIRKLRARISRLERIGAPVDPVMFAAADLSRGIPCTDAAFITTHVASMFRSRKNTLYSWLVVATGAGSVVEARLHVDAPGLGAVDGPATATPATGGPKWLLVTVQFPDEWPTLTPMTIAVQARRVSGADPTTVQPTTSWTS